MTTFDEKTKGIQDRIRAHPGLGKQMAKYGAVGAVLAIPLPFVGPVLGAAVGAGVAYARRNKA